MTEKLIKSDDRVKDHGEVFTPKHIVSLMLDQPEIKAKVNDLNATFLEPAAGEGAFLTELLRRKMDTAVRESKTAGQFGRNSLIALSTLYGIEFLEDNVETLVMNMILTFVDSYQKVINNRFNSDPNPKVIKSAKVIIRANMAQGDTLKKTTATGEPIIFSEWKPMDERPARVQRTEYTFESIINKSGPTNSVKDVYEQLDLFAGSDDGSEETVQPKNRHYLPCTWEEIYKQKFA